MTFDELSQEQKIQVKEWILDKRNEARGEGTSYDELANADDLVSDEDAREWSEGTDFVPDDFSHAKEHDGSGSIETTTVENVPQWAVPYFVNGDVSGMDAEDIKLATDFEKKLLDQGLRLICQIDGTENEFCHCPAFGLACDTVDFEAEVLKKDGKEES